MKLALFDLIKYFILQIILIITSMVCIANPVADSKQLVLVISKDWRANSGKLQRYKKLDAGDWQEVAQEVKVVLGKNGMGWGIGLHDDIAIAKEPHVSEGSKCSPAGIFTIPAAFGKDSNKDWLVKLPYKQISKTIFCIDDPKSENYNRIVDTNSTMKDWDSSENMEKYMNEGLYTYGAMLGHNPSSVVPSKGSCIFVHVWRDSSKPTAGCTAMAKEDVKEIVSWIDPQKSPVWVQLPENVYNRIKYKWGLP